MKKVKRALLTIAIVGVCSLGFWAKSTEAQEVITTKADNIQETTTAENPTIEQPTTDIYPDVKYKLVNKGVYVKSDTISYKEPEGEISVTLKKGVRYKNIKKGDNGYSVIQIDDEKICYVKTTYLTSTATAKKFVNIKDKKYSYENMKNDIKSLTRYYGTILKSEELARTADNRNIYCLTLGNPDAKKTIVVETAAHGREWLNTQLMMKVVEDYCRKYDTGSYDGKNIADVFDKIKICIIPMLNPDGVSISQYGLKGVRNAALRKKVKRIAKGNYRTWKANARGVDVNRNFKEGYGYQASKKPSATGSCGKKALSEVESRAIVKLVDKVKPKAVICYHEAGEVIYYRNNSKLLRVVKKLTGYTPYKEGPKEYGTFADFLDRRGIINCTPETCVVPAPVSHSQFKKAYSLNKDVLIATARTYMER